MNVGTFCAVKGGGWESLLHENRRRRVRLHRFYRAVVAHLFAEEILSSKTAKQARFRSRIRCKKNEMRASRYAIFDYTGLWRESRDRVGPSERGWKEEEDIVREREREKEIVRDSIRDTFINSARNSVIVRTIDETTVRTRKSRATKERERERVHGENGLANLWNMAASSQSWRFIGLIVTRARRHDDVERATGSKTSGPLRQNIFTPERERDEAGLFLGTKKERLSSRARQRLRRCLRSRCRKVDRREFTNARFMDYRSSAREFIEQTERGVVEEKFSAKNETATLDENTFGCEKDEIEKKNCNTSRVWRKHTFARGSCKWNCGFFTTCI